jgi:undecaprenyl pyrophosphate synthase
MVVGGSVAEWGALTDDQWEQRVDTLGRIAADAGASWLTLRPFERGLGADAARPVHHDVSPRHGCVVIVDPSADGRERLTVALRKAIESRPAGSGGSGGSLDEAAVDRVLLAPAEHEPDLVLLLGSSDRLPTSLVWELAYSELVYVDVAWSELRSEHLADAITAYQSRHRRFGGVD